MLVNGKALSLLVPVLTGIGLTAATLASAGARADGPLRCEIRAVAAGGMVSLAATAESDATRGGTYRFTVESISGSGNSSIRQGGGFSATPGARTELGKVMLGANGIYDARLELKAGGESVTCEERVGGSL